MEDSDGKDNINVAEKIPFTKNFDASKIKYLNVETGSQDIFVTGTKENTASVKLTIRKGYDETKCYYNVGQIGDTLNIKLEQKMSWHSFSRCDASVEVKIPEKTPVSTKVGSGDIRINNISGDITSRAGSGNIFIDASSTKIESKTGSGDSELILRAANLKAIANFKTGSGNITVKMPKDAKVNITHIHGSGKTYNEFGTSDNPNVIINAHSGSGDLYAKKI